jgi:hypothetical protein
MLDIGRPFVGLEIGIGIGIGNGKGRFLVVLCGERDEKVYHLGICVHVMWPAGKAGKDEIGGGAEIALPPDVPDESVIVETGRFVVNACMGYYVFGVDSGN